MKRLRENEAPRLYLFWLPCCLLEYLVGFLAAKDLRALGRCIAAALQEEDGRGWRPLVRSSAQLARPVLQPYLRMLQQSMQGRSQFSTSCDDRYLEAVRDALKTKGDAADVAEAVRALGTDPLFAIKHFLLTDLYTHCEMSVARHEYWKGTRDAPHLCERCNERFEWTRYHSITYADYPTGLAFVRIETLRRICNRPKGNASLATEMGGVRYLEQYGYKVFYLADVMAWKKRHPTGLRPTKQPKPKYLPFP